MAPGGPVRTGISPRIETPRYLSLNPLDGFQVIYLANVERLDESAVEALERYVKAGGGLAVFLGPRCRATFVNEELYRDGKGLFPLPLSDPAELLVDRLEKTPDLEVTDHPIFRVFAGAAEQVPFDGQRQPVLRRAGGLEARAGLDRPGDCPAAQRRPAGRRAGVRRGPRGRADHDGRAGLEQLGANNPSFVVAIQEMQAYLARRPAATKTHLVGEPLGLELPPGKYEPTGPLRDAGGRRPGSPSVDAAPAPDGSLVASLAQTDTSGVYEAQLTATDGTSEVRRYAVNVDPVEGDLATLSGEQLAARLEGVPYDYRQAAEFGTEGPQEAGYNLGTALLYVLVVLLLVEQILAWSARTIRQAARKAAGGAA